jgi:hypothetical protein
MSTEEVRVWFAILGSMLGAATVYLRMVVDKRLSELRAQILDRLDADYVRMDLFKLQYADILKRLDKIDEHVENLRKSRSGSD